MEFSMVWNAGGLKIAREFKGFWYSLIIEWE